MSNSYNDSQKELTKKSLEIALALLIRETPLDKISISAVCQRAGVSRMAFYRHFANLREVLQSYLDGEQESTFADLEKDDNPDRNTVGLRFLNWIEENRELFSALFAGNMQNILIDYVARGMEIYYRKYLPHTYRNNLEKEYLIRYEAGGFVSVIGKWLERGCIDSREEIMMMFDRQLVPPTGFIKGEIP